MQIVIPMSGFGERFRRAGYSVPKPLIEVDGKPIIAHVIEMFPGEQDFVFICNQEHLNNSDYGMEAILTKYCPKGQIIGIPPHKLGPIHAVRQAEHLIDFDRPVVVKRSLESHSVIDTKTS
jgi:NDP-sugar pyrophosphorylase family protein